MSPRPEQGPFGLQGQTAINNELAVLQTSKFPYSGNIVVINVPNASYQSLSVSANKVPGWTLFIDRVSNTNSVIYLRRDSNSSMTLDELAKSLWKVQAIGTTFSGVSFATQMRPSAYSRRPIAYPSTTLSGSVKQVVYSLIQSIGDYYKELYNGFVLTSTGLYTITKEYGEIYKIRDVSNDVVRIVPVDRDTLYLVNTTASTIQQYTISTATTGSAIPFPAGTTFVECSQTLLNNALFIFNTTANNQLVMGCLQKDSTSLTLANNVPSAPGGTAVQVVTANSTTLVFSAAGDDLMAISNLNTTPANLPNASFLNPNVTGNAVKIRSADIRNTIIYGVRTNGNPVSATINTTTLAGITAWTDVTTLSTLQGLVPDFTATNFEYGPQVYNSGGTGFTGFCFIITSGSGSSLGKTFALNSSMTTLEEQNEPQPQWGTGATTYTMSRATNGYSTWAYWDDTGVLAMLVGSRSQTFSINSTTSTNLEVKPFSPTIKQELNAALVNGVSSTPLDNVETDADLYTVTVSTNGQGKLSSGVELKGWEVKEDSTSSKVVFNRTVQTGYTPSDELVKKTTLVVEDAKQVGDQIILTSAYNGMLTITPPLTGSEVITDVSVPNDGSNSIFVAACEFTNIKTAAGSKGRVLKFLSGTWTEVCKLTDGTGTILALACPNENDIYFMAGVETTTTAGTSAGGTVKPMYFTPEFPDQGISVAAPEVWISTYQNCVGYSMVAIGQTGTLTTFQVDNTASASPGTMYVSRVLQSSYAVSPANPLSLQGSPAAAAADNFVSKPIQTKDAVYIPCWYGNGRNMFTATNAQATENVIVAIETADSYFYNATSVQINPLASNFVAGSRQPKTDNGAWMYGIFNDGNFQTIARMQLAKRWVYNVDPGQWTPWASISGTDRLVQFQPIDSTGLKFVALIQIGGTGDPQLRTLTVTEGANPTELGTIAIGTLEGAPTLGTGSNVFLNTIGDFFVHDQKQVSFYGSETTASRTLFNGLATTDVTPTPTVNPDTGGSESGWAKARVYLVWVFLVLFVGLAITLGVLGGLKWIRKPDGK